MKHCDKNDINSCKVQEDDQNQLDFYNSVLLSPGSIVQTRTRVQPPGLGVVHGGRGGSRPCPHRHLHRTEHAAAWHPGIGVHAEFRQRPQGDAPLRRQSEKGGAGVGQRADQDRRPPAAGAADAELGRAERRAGPRRRPAGHHREDRQPLPPEEAQDPPPPPQAPQAKTSVPSPRGPWAEGTAPPPGGVT